MTGPTPDPSRRDKLLTRLVERLRSRSDSEHEQALVRIGFGVVTIGFCCYLLATSREAVVNPTAIVYPLYVAAAGLAASVLVFALILWRPAVSSARRYGCIASATSGSIGVVAA